MFYTVCSAFQSGYYESKQIKAGENVRKMMYDILHMEFKTGKCRHHFFEGGGVFCWNAKDCRQEGGREHFVQQPGVGQKSRKFADVLNGWSYGAGTVVFPQEPTFEITSSSCQVCLSSTPGCAKSRFSTNTQFQKLVSWLYC